MIIKNLKIIRSKFLKSYLVQRIKIYKIIFECISGCEKLPILIYQMGKVGSSSVYNTLKKSKHNIPVLHYHFLNPENITNIKSFFTDNAPYNIPSVIYEGELLGDFIIKHPRTCRWKVVTLVRDPVAREISNIFQNLKRLIPEYNAKHTDSINIELISNYLMEKFENFNEDADFVTNWFDKELKAVFNVDVYDLPFNHDQGYRIYHSENAAILLIRLESLSSCFTSGFEDFCGIKGLELINDNVGNKKDYSSIYAGVKSKMQLPESVLSRIYSSKYARKFYTEKEIGGFIGRWASVKSDAKLIR